MVFPKKVMRYLKKKKRQLLREPMRIDFEGVYKNGGFGGNESFSGTGSTLDQTTTIRSELPPLFKKYSIKSMLDAPCGDFNWMRHVDLSGVNYVGGDVVAEIISDNTKKYPSHSFTCLDLRYEPIPQVDLIFCRDCFVHLPFKDISLVVQKIKESGSNYLMLTTFPETDKNIDTVEVLWRPLNMQNAPFNFPKPIDLIIENCTENDGQHAHKALGLWNISSLPTLGR